MPCFRCSSRQTDPVRGASPWSRAVVGGVQVLVCPGCQQNAGWVDGLDRCARCGSHRLVKALGAVACRGCGFESWPDGPAEVTETATAAGPVREAAVDGRGAAAAAPPVDVPPGEAPAATDVPAARGGSPPEGEGLAAEVAAALDRVLRRAVL
jgi:hypothetical protein